jgi:hypothetical protein
MKDQVTLIADLILQLEQPKAAAASTSAATADEGHADKKPRTADQETATRPHSGGHPAWSNWDPSGLTADVSCLQGVRGLMEKCRLAFLCCHFMRLNVL